ncbi:hypothetical protein KCP70_14680 [Salmonella enterica subsp. enterica]|nr:hypothetical protein KCP70_14680 [Salmonella enterica subsp. enterica]
MFDGIRIGYGGDLVKTLAEYSVCRYGDGLTDEYHPTQLHSGSAYHAGNICRKVKPLTGRWSMPATRVITGNSMLEAAALTGLDLRLVAPKACWPQAALVAECSAMAKKNGGTIT